MFNKPWKPGGGGGGGGAPGGGGGGGGGPNKFISLVHLNWRFNTIYETNY